MEMTDKFIAKISYVFTDDILNTPIVVSTTKVKLNKKNKESLDVEEIQYVTVIENLPVLTFRGGSWAKDIIGSSPELNKALDVHNKVVGGKP
jgi:hypothetical protein